MKKQSNTIENAALKVEIGRVVVFSILLTALLLMEWIPRARAEHTRVTVPDAFGVELLGRSMLWSVNYDRVLSDDLSAGFGFGTVGTKYKVNGADTSTSAKMLPAYVNYYFLQEQGSPFVTAGAAIVLNNSEVQNYKAAVSTLKFNSTAVIPQFGVGYENRSEIGFMVRGTAYGMVADNFAVWFGIHFGYAW